MNKLLADIINAHGGLSTWNAFQTVDATVVTGGGFFRFKGQPVNQDPRRVTVWLHEERATLVPYGAPDQRLSYTPGRVVIEKLDGSLIAERAKPRDAFAGHQMNTPWDPLHYAYFNGDALWTYFTTPFLLQLSQVRAEEVEPWCEGPEVWRVLRANFPSSIATHSTVQDFFFDEHLLLRRHDYTVDVAGGFGAVQLTSDYIEVQGMRLPTKRRAYTRTPDGKPIKDMLMVYIDISNVRFA